MSRPPLRSTELADRQDACRETGRTMVTGAIVNDWLHPALNDRTRPVLITGRKFLPQSFSKGHRP